jgi:hypothetical protein
MHSVRPHQHCIALKGGSTVEWVICFCGKVAMDATERRMMDKREGKKGLAACQKCLCKHPKYASPAVSNCWRRGSWSQVWLVLLWLGPPAIGRKCWIEVTLVHRYNYLRHPACTQHSSLSCTSRAAYTWMQHAAPQHCHSCPDQN